MRMFPHEAHLTQSVIRVLIYNKKLTSLTDPIAQVFTRQGLPHYLSTHARVAEKMQAHIGHSNCCFQ